jgi:hypothetical protein
MAPHEPCDLLLLFVPVFVKTVFQTTHFLLIGEPLEKTYFSFLLRANIVQARGGTC